MNRPLKTIRNSKGQTMIEVDGIIMLLSEVDRYLARKARREATRAARANN